MAILLILTNVFVLFLFCRDKLVGEEEVSGSEIKVYIFFFIL